MGRFSNIQGCIQDRLDSVPGKPKIVFLNDKEYNPRLGTRYWAIRIVPIRSEKVTVEGLQRHFGKIEVFIYNKANIGTKQIADDMDAIHDIFNNNISAELNGTKVQFLGVQPGAAIVEKSWCYSVLEIEYLCYTL